MQVNNSQDYTRQLKNRINAALSLSSPPPQKSKTNALNTSVTTNLASQFVRQISAPARVVDSLTSFSFDKTGQTKSDWARYKPPVVVVVPILDSLTLPISGSNDAYIVSYKSSGIISWAAKISSGGNDSGLSVTTDSSKNIYVTGWYSGATTLYNSDGTSGATLSVTGATNTFIAKYSTSGTVIWAARITGGTSQGRGNLITIDTSGNVIVLGMYVTNNSIVYDKNGTNVATLLLNDITYSENFNYFIVSYTSDGAFNWVATIGKIANVTLSGSVTTDTDGNVLVTGSSYSGRVYTKTGSLAATLPASCNFVVSYKQDGTFNWVYRIGSSMNYGLSIARGLSGKFFVTGSDAGSNLVIYDKNGNTVTTLTNLVGSIYIVSYTSSGTFDWASTIESTTGSKYPYSMATDSLGNLVVVGSYDSTLTVYDKTHTSVATLTTSGGTDSFIVSYKQDGTFNWAAKLGGSSTDEANGVATDSVGNILVTGRFISGTLNIYDKTGTIVNTLIRNAYATFIVSFKTDGTVNWAARATGQGAIVGYGITCDSSQNVISTGNYVSNPGTFYSTGK